MNIILPLKSNIGVNKMVSFKEKFLFVCLIFVILLICLLGLYNTSLQIDELDEAGKNFKLDINDLLISIYDYNSNLVDICFDEFETDEDRIGCMKANLFDPRKTSYGD